MYYVVDTDKSFEQASKDLDHAVREHNFGVLHVHDVGNTLRDKGVPFDEQCQIFEVCNPIQAGRVLSSDMRLNMALPCRISVYTEKGKTRIGLIKPMEMLSSLSSEPDLLEVAREVEKQTIQIVNDAR